MMFIEYKRLSNQSIGEIKLWAGHYPHPLHWEIPRKNTRFLLEHFASSVDEGPI